MPPLNVPHHLQETDSSCVPACAHMVLAFLGITQTESELRRLLKTRAYGTSVLNIRHLEILNVKTHLLSGTLEELRSAVENDQPAIVLLWTGVLNHWASENAIDYLHAVVIIGFDGENLLVNDPAFESHPISISREEFLDAWSYGR